MSSTNMMHPLIGDVSDKSIEELSEIINNLTKKLSFVSRTNNFAMANQISMALNSYRNEMDKKQKELLDVELDSIDQIIDIR